MQYNDLYVARLRQLHGAVLEQDRALWDNLVPPPAFLGNVACYTCGGAGTEVVLIGVTFKDITRCTDIAEPADALALCLEARHLAPTAPDTLPAQPFEKADPFVIETRPHVLFSGGHRREAFQWHALRLRASVPPAPRHRVGEFAGSPGRARGGAQ